MKTDVVVVGAGLAGLTAAVGLAAQGVQVVVLEGSPTLGGRARSVIDGATGDSIPIGPHILLTEYHNMLRLLELLGRGTDVVWQREEFISIVDGADRACIRQSLLPAPFHYIPCLFRDRTTANLDWASNIPVTLYALSLDAGDLARLDAVPADDLLRRLRVTDRYQARFWAFISHAIMNIPLEACSAGALMRFYRRLIGQRTYQVGFPANGLGELFVDESRAFIESSGGAVMTEALVTGVLVEHGVATGVVLRDGRKISADTVVAAVPPQALLPSIGLDVAALFPALASLKAFHACPYISVFLWFDTKITDQRFWARIPAPGALNCDFYDLTNIQTQWLNRPSLITSNIINSDRIAYLTDYQIVCATRRELAEYCPTAATATLLHWRVNRIPMAIPCAFVDAERFRLPTATPIGELFLAGDWLDTGLPMSMESACLSGWLAAEHALASRGLQPLLAVPHPDIDPIARTLGVATRYGRRLLTGISGRS